MNEKTMDIARCLSQRHACKAFDPQRGLTAEQIVTVKQLLRLSPSSVNSQPWHFLLGVSPESKRRIAKSAEQEIYSFNKDKILNSGLVVVFCVRTELTDDYLAALKEKELADGRFPNPEAAQKQAATRAFYVGRHRNELQDTSAWLARQVYLALGALLLAAPAIGLDACPIEGFDAPTLDREFELPKQGYTSLVLAALGYRSDEDFNAKLPKSRFEAGQVFTML